MKNLRLIRYASLRLQGFSAHAASALSPTRGDKAAGIVSAIVLLWMLADMIAGM